MKRFGWTGALAMAAAVALADPGGAWAEDKPRVQDAPKSGAKKIVRPQELRVEGKVERPKAAPITPPPMAVPAERERARSHVPKILEALEGDAF